MELKEIIHSYDHKKLTKVNSHKNHMIHKSASNVDFLVEKIVTTFANPQFTPLYRKAAWYLSDAVIIGFMEKASQANSPAHYFVRCAKNELLKNKS